MKQICVLLVVAATILARGASAQEGWPNRPIKVVVPVSPGGGFDLMARILVDGVSKQLSQQVYVDNVGGAGGLKATREVARSDADGYTFLFTGPQHATLPFMFKDPGYDVKADFASVALVARYPIVVVINPSTPANNLAEFIALVKEAPGKYSFGSSGVGGASHIFWESFTERARLRMIHVPYRGAGETTAALLGGQITVVADGLSAQIGNIRQGLVRALAVATKERWPTMPNLQSISETVPGYYYPLWAGVFTPAKTPKPIVDKMTNAIAEALKNAAVRKRYEDLLVEPVGSSSQELDKFLDEQLAFNKEIIKKANIQINE
jgi:tripartite-type tricarboxylate transporter receptor subunit TctC